MSRWRSWGLLVSNTGTVRYTRYGLCGRKATLNLNGKSVRAQSCVNVEVAVLGSSSLTVLIDSADVKQHLTLNIQE